MARPKLGDSSTERLHIKITADELSAIDEWQQRHGLASRSEAVRQLCATAMQQEEKRKIDRDRAIMLMNNVTKAFRLMPNEKSADIFDMGRKAVEFASAFIDGRPYSYAQMKGSAFPDETLPNDAFEEIAVTADFVRGMLIHYKRQESELE